MTINDVEQGGLLAKLWKKYYGNNGAKIRNRCTITINGRYSKENNLCVLKSVYKKSWALEIKVASR